MWRSAAWSTHCRPRSTCWRPRIPIEQEGTYPLPEAQLDRFLLQVEIAYPDPGAERAMLLATTGADDRRRAAVALGGRADGAQALIRRVPVGESVVDAILALVRGGRPETATTRPCAAMSPGAPGRAPPRR